MPPLSWKRDASLNYHLEEGKSWLANCNTGKNTTALSYAAFEFRLAIERIGSQYWYCLKGDSEENEFLKEIRSYKRIENKIYQLAGHQKQINARFEFARILLKFLKIEIQLITPQLGKLSHYWSECSELCHISWTIVSRDIGIANQQFTNLKNIAEFIATNLAGLVSWSKIVDLPFCEIEEQYLKGEIIEKDIYKYLQERGIWARIQYDDNRPSEFIGEAIPPSSS